ncbi:hypothetical protein DITRI_Ditri15bG0047800 [Diplodiscus trichospermus]
MAAKGFSEASSSGFKGKHDVFLSFSGDTRKNFTDHLYETLVRGGVDTYRDDNELPRGQDISSELLKQLKNQRFLWWFFLKTMLLRGGALLSLSRSLNAKASQARLLFQSSTMLIHLMSGNRPEVMQKLLLTTKNVLKMRWKGSKSGEKHLLKLEIYRVGTFKTWQTGCLFLKLIDFKNQNFHRYESRFIQMIIEDVYGKLNRSMRNGLHVATHPVALESRVKRVMELLDIGSDEVRIVGIHGISGIGKTTIANAVYNMVYGRFEGCSFLSNIKDDIQQPNSLARKQEQLLSDILSWKDIKIDNIDRGVNLIKERLCCRRVFIVLDDMDDSMQWRQLVGDRKSLGPRSRILVTTRDERLLTGLEVDKRYKVKKLNYEESIQLLSWHAFRRLVPEKDYLELSNRLVHHAQGLPLALEILGSYLFKRSQPEWESFMEKLQKIPHHQIQKKLRIST